MAFSSPGGLNSELWWDVGLQDAVVLLWQQEVVAGESSAVFPAPSSGLRRPNGGDVSPRAMGSCWRSFAVDLGEDLQDLAGTVPCHGLIEG